MKKHISLIVCLILVISMNSNSYAQNLDLVNLVDSQKNYTFNEFSRVPTNFRFVLANIDDYGIEWQGEYYNIGEVDALTSGPGGVSFTEAISQLQPIGDPLEVIDIY